MKKCDLVFPAMLALIVAGIAGTALSGCAQQNANLPAGTDNVPDNPNWERIADIPGPRCTRYDGIYKVIDTEDSTIMYYALRCGQLTGIPALAYYHEGSKENYRQIDG